MIDDSDSSFKSYCEGLIKHPRYAGTFFNRPSIKAQKHEKYINESSVVRLLQESYPHLSGKRSHPEEDPPDIIVTQINGNIIGVEVTEFVNPETLIKNIKYYRNIDSDSPETFYTTDFSSLEGKNFFYNKLSDIVKTKTEKTKEVVGKEKYDKLILLIATNESMLNEEMFLSLVQTKVWQSDTFQEIYFLLDYKPNLDGEGYYPCYRIDKLINRT